MSSEMAATRSAQMFSASGVHIIDADRCVVYCIGSADIVSKTMPSQITMLPFPGAVRSSTRSYGSSVIELLRDGAGALQPPSEYPQVMRRSDHPKMRRTSVGCLKGGTECLSGVRREASELKWEVTQPMRIYAPCRQHRVHSHFGVFLKLPCRVSACSHAHLVCRSARHSMLSPRAPCRLR